MLKTLLAITLYGMSPLAAAPQDDSTSAQAKVCSEMCIMAQSQDFLVAITSRRRPAWARTILMEIPDYAACGVKVISDSGKTLYADFDETDALFDAAYAECADERAAFDDTVREKLLADGVFETAEEADAQMIPLRAMLFGAKISDIFGGEGNVGSPADNYAASRFPEFYTAFQSRRNAPPVMPLPEPVEPPLMPRPAPEIEPSQSPERPNF